MSPVSLSDAPNNPFLLDRGRLSSIFNTLNLLKFHILYLSELHPGSWRQMDSFQNLFLSLRVFRRCLKAFYPFPSSFLVAPRPTMKPKNLELLLNSGFYDNPPCSHVRNVWATLFPFPLFFETFYSYCRRYTVTSSGYSVPPSDFVYRKTLYPPLRSSSIPMKVPPFSWRVEFIPDSSQ